MANYKKDDKTTNKTTTNKSTVAPTVISEVTNETPIVPVFQPTEVKVKNEIILNMDAYSSCKNLCNWDIHFSLVGANTGDKTIKANGVLDMLNRDIASLCANGNIFFVGEGNGDHARIHIQNEQLRVYVGFESEDGSRIQSILDDRKLKQIFDSKTQKEFEEVVARDIVAFHEKDIVMDYAKRVGINDYSKISYLEEFTNRKFKND